MKYLGIFLVTLYQWVISPLKHVFFGVEASCRFYPTCSHYAKECFLAHGFIKGLYLTTLRLLKCHPLHNGGHDPVPSFKK